MTRVAKFAVIGLIALAAALLLFSERFGNTVSVYVSPDGEEGGMNDDTANENFPETGTLRSEDESFANETHYETEGEFMERIGERMKQRRETLQRVCERLGLPKEPFHPQKMMEAKRFNFLHCRIPKAGSNNMDKVFEKLVRKEDYAPVKTKRLDPHQMEFITESNFNIEEINNYTRTILVRDPFVRLVSSYRMKAHGNNKQKLTKAIWRTRDLIPINPTFEEYVDHLNFHPGPANIIERHWARYFDLCQPCHIHYDVIAQLETIEEDSRYLFTLIGAPRNVTFSDGYGRDGQSKTSRESITKYFETVPKRKIRQLYNLYSPDYEMFGYPPPSELN